MLFLALVLTLIPNSFALTCPSNWLEVEGDCFLFVVTPTATFQDAQVTCSSMTGALTQYATLAKINPVEPEYSAFLGRRPLLSLQSQFTPQFLIGLSDTATEGEYRWLDGTWPIDINWAPGHPVRISAEVEERLDCVVINDAGQWENVQCTQAYSYVCSIIHGTVPGTEFNECAVPGAEQELCPGIFDFCEDAAAEYHCECFPGFFKNDNNVCEDINECATHQCELNEMCTNTDSSFFCSCLPGHTESTDPLVKGCLDIDECADNGTCKGFQENCTNFAGGFTCECNVGYVKDEMNKCVDADECAVDINPCTGENEVCMNIPGSFSCLCEQYFSRESEDANAICVPDPICCPSGFELLGTNCHIIIPQPMGYENALQFCETFGYKMSKIEPLNPVTNYLQGNWPQGQSGLWIGLNDRNAEGLFIWVSDGQLVGALNNRWGSNEPSNILPSLDCVFMTMEGTWHTTGCSPTIIYPFSCQRRALSQCPPINRCENPSLNPCNPANQICQYEYGTERCVCKDGFKENANGNCEDINECTELGMCQAGFEQCENLAGSHQCLCVTGTQRKDGLCQDVNECEFGNPCSGNRICLNQLGTFLCVCALGYRLNGTTCFDIDECAENSHSCNGDGEYCTNLEGGYRCDIVTCLPGYFRVGLECFDINECELGVCNRTSEHCVNTNGTFECRCADGTNRDINNRCVPVCCPDGTMAIGDFCYKILSAPENIVDFPTALQQCQTSVEGTTGVLAKLDDEHLLLTALSDQLGIDGDHWVGFEKDQQDFTQYRWFLDRTLVSQEPHRWRQGGPVQISGLENCGLVNLNTYLLDNVYCDIRRPSICQYRQISCDGTNPCETVSPCENNPNTMCVYEGGQVQCICIPGFVMDTVTQRCSDIECVLGDPSSCSHPLETCYFSSNNALGFYCDCIEPEFYHRGPDGDCVDIDECLTTICPGLNQQCVNKERGYFCACRDEFEALANGTCVLKSELINECELNPCEGTHVVCDNKPVGFSCDCLPGYRATSELGNCVDINECEECFGLCEHTSNACDYHIFLSNSKCVNVPGTFVCDCVDGFLQDGDSCKDINECLRSAPCIDIPNSECKNVAGGSECVCRTGFVPDVNANCVDVEECIETPNICDTQGPNRECLNIPGSYRCICSLGFDEINGACVPNQEIVCAGANNPCSDAENEICVNDMGLPACMCKIGYFLNDTVCLAVSACNADANACDVGSELCVDTAPGEFRCDCRAGYISDPQGNCISTHICRTDDSLCTDQVNQVCVSRAPGEYECVCGEGFERLEGICTAVDVCLSSLSVLCGPNEFCQATGIGQFNCTCQQGFNSMNGGPCEPNDPCDEANACGANEVCSNNAGVAVCTCIPGFALMNGICQDENEFNPCSTPNICGENEQCIRRETGSIVCVCMDGFIQQGGVCVPQEASNLCNMTDICGVNERCSVQAGTVLCSCLEGYIMQGGICQEAPNPCDNPNICRVNEQCVLREGGTITCICVPGYIQRNGICQLDTDPCQSANVCGMNEVCSNNGGVALCTCMDGFSLLDNVCQPDNAQDLCIEAACGDNADCAISNNAAVCFCLEGFTRQDDRCVPTSMTGCANVPDLCSSDREECVERNGLILCECIAGYFRPFIVCVREGGECDISANNCPGNNEVCISVFGTPVCECIENHVRNNNFECVAKTAGIVCTIGSNDCGVNEICIQQLTENACVCQDSFDRDASNQCVFSGSICETNPNICPSNANCVDDSTIATGFRCDCVQGFVLTANGRCEMEITDICLSMPMLCPDPLENCVPKEGGTFSCECVEGYWRQTPNAQCSIMNMCLTGPCTGDFEECVDDMAGGFSCVCSDGYLRETENAPCTASANNPCLSSPCAPFVENCRVVGEIYMCDCIDGYIRLTAGAGCEDPCSPNPCTGEFEMCRPQDGTVTGYVCDCITGYNRPEPNMACTAQVSLCVPNPCTLPNEVCEQSGQTERGFICACMDGYSRNVDNDMCEASACSTNNICTGLNEHCVEGDRPGLFSCECLPGFLRTTDAIFCVSENIDEICTSHSGLCPDELQLCQSGDVAGEYRCECIQGYVRETATGVCIESSFTISTCEVNPQYCNGDREVCIDGTLPGSYLCECQIGFVYIQGVCSEQIACIAAPCLMENEVCIDLPEGLFRCDCRPGYSRADSGSCEVTVLTTCTVLLDLCTETEDCIDLEDNNYECVCKDGHLRFPDNVCYATCAVGVLELCGDNAGCVDTPENTVKYRCDCNFGFLKVDGRCFVSPTCSSNPNPCGGVFEVCVDLLDTGTFRCDCQEFYHRVNGICTVRLDCCPSKGTFIEGLCYEFKNGEYSFSGAEQNCSLTATDGHLAKVLPSQALQNFMLEEIMKLDLFIAWIGLTNSPEWGVQNGVFTWLSDRDTVSLTHPSWQGIPPDDACIVVDVNLAWKSSRCDLPTRVFCQYGALPCVDPPPPMTSDECLTNPCTEENQICIDTPQAFICNCMPGTNEINGRCLYIATIVDSLRILEMNGLEANYSRMLSDPSVTEFIELSKFFCDALMNTLLKTVNGTAPPMETECTVSRFRPGSIITDYQVRVGEASAELANDFIFLFEDELEEVVNERGETIYTADGSGNLTISQVVRDDCDRITCLNDGVCLLDDRNKAYCECDFTFEGEFCETENNLFFLFQLLGSAWFGWTLFLISIIPVIIVCICCYCIYVRRKKATQAQKSSLQTVVSVPSMKKGSQSNPQNQPLVHSMESAASTPDSQRRRRRNGHLVGAHNKGQANGNAMQMKKQPPPVAAKPGTANGGPKPGPSRAGARSPQRSPSRRQASPSPSSRGGQSPGQQKRSLERKGPAETGSLQRPGRRSERGSERGTLERSLERGQNRASQRSNQSRVSQNGGNRPSRPPGKGPQRSPSRASQASNASKGPRQGPPRGRPSTSSTGGRNGGPNQAGKPPQRPRKPSPGGKGSQSPNNRVRRKINGGKVPKPNKGPETAPTIYI